MRYDPEQVTAAFNRLFSTYPQFAAADLAESAGAYFEAVEPYETVDILAAVKSFLSGSAPGHNPAFAPSAPLVGAETRRLMNLRLDRERRDALSKPRLPPPDIVHTPESRARVAAMAQAHIERMADIARTEDAEMDRRQRDLAARTNARFAPDMSPEAMRRRLGFSVGDRDGQDDAA